MKKIRFVMVMISMLNVTKTYGAGQILDGNLVGPALFDAFSKGLEDLLHDWLFEKVNQIQTDLEGPDAGLERLHAEGDVLFQKIINSCRYQEIGEHRRNISELASWFSSISVQAGEIRNSHLHPESYHLPWMRTEPMRKMNEALICLLGEERSRELMFK